MMRIITGKARGVRLETLEGEATRPTAERAKEAVFSALQFELEGRKVLDLFAGSGQLGLEAISRGAEGAMFVDASPDAMAIIKRNAQKTGFFAQSRFLISDYRSYLRKAAGRDGYDLIFLDPPYADRAVGDAIARILQAKLALPGCIFVCESEQEDPLQDCPAGAKQLTLRKQNRYGRAYVHLYVYDPQGGETQDVETSSAPGEF